jgi:hypothetical protein
MNRLYPPKQAPRLSCLEPKLMQRLGAKVYGPLEGER